MAKLWQIVLILSVFKSLQNAVIRVNPYSAGVFEV